MSEATATIGKYVLIRPLGAGAMGQVHLAHDPEADRLVAVKVVRDAAIDQELLDRFLREGRATAKLRHVNIVTVYEVGEHGGRPFIAMEFVDGIALSDLLEHREPLTLAEKLSYLEQICAGLHFAHRSRIVHRDVKPANLMIDSEGIVRILDFGIARLGNAGMTRAGAMLGTLSYMSPEQMLGRPVDHRSDMFSVGAVAYELLTGEKAFPGDLDTGLLHRLAYEDPPRIGSRRPELPDGLEEIVFRALRKSPDERFADLGETAAALRRLQIRLTDQAVTTLATPVGSHSELIRQSLVEAESRVRLGDLAGAASTLDHVVALDPREPAALALLARVRQSAVTAHGASTTDASVEDGESLSPRTSDDDSSEQSVFVPHVHRAVVRSRWTWAAVVAGVLTIATLVVASPGVLIPKLLSAFVATLLPGAQAQRPPELTAPVNDFAALIDLSSETVIASLIESLHQATGDVLVVATVDTYRSHATLEDYAAAMFENHGKGIGDRGKDNGTLVVLAAKDREVRVQVGDGLAEFVTGEFASETCRQMVRAFQHGNYADGLKLGAWRIIARIAEGRNVALSSYEVLATVDGRLVTASDFQRRLRAQLQAYRGAYGGNASPELLRQLGIEQMILQQMIDEQVALIEAERRGIAVSGDELHSEVRSLPSLQEEGGFVGEQRYHEILANQQPPMTVEEFEDGLRRSVVIERLRAAVTSGVAVNDADRQQQFFANWTAQAKQRMKIHINDAAVKRLAAQ